jgi:hypothetical protein
MFWPTGGLAPACAVLLGDAFPTPLSHIISARQPVLLLLNLSIRCTIWTRLFFFLMIERRRCSVGVVKTKACETRARAKLKKKKTPHPTQ